MLLGSSDAVAEHLVWLPTRGPCFTRVSQRTLSESMSMVSEDASCSDKQTILRRPDRYLIDGLTKARDEAIYE